MDSFVTNFLPAGCREERRQNTSKLANLCGTSTALLANMSEKTANRSRCVIALMLPLVAAHNCGSTSIDTEGFKNTSIDGHAYRSTSIDNRVCRRTDIWLSWLQKYQY